MEKFKQFYLNTINVINENHIDGTVTSVVSGGATTTTPTTFQKLSSTDIKNIYREENSILPVNKLRDNDKNANDNNRNDNNNENLQKNFSIKKKNSRLNFQKSHTCGSLFAKCSCDRLSATTTTTSSSSLLSLATTTAPILTYNNTDQSVNGNNNIFFQNTTTHMSQPQLNHRNSINNNFVVYENSVSGGTTDICYSINDIDNLKRPQIQSNQQQQSENFVNDKTVDKSDDHPVKLLANNPNTVTKKSTKKLFQSYSHPDTTFIFTDANRKPSKYRSNNSLVSPTATITSPSDFKLKKKNSNEFIIRHSKSSIINWKSNDDVFLNNYEIIKNHNHKKRSSSPNIRGDNNNDYTILNVHPEILLKIVKDNNNDECNDDNERCNSMTSTTTTAAKIVTNKNGNKENFQQNNDDQVTNINMKKTSNQSRTTQNHKSNLSQNQAIATGSKDLIETTTKSIMTNMKINQKNMNNVKEKITYYNDDDCDVDKNSDNDDDDILFDRCGCDSEKRARSLINEIVTLKDIVKNRDTEIHKLKREIHKLKSVLQQTAHHMPFADCNLLTSLQKTNSNKLINNYNNNCEQLTTPLSPSPPPPPSIITNNCINNIAGTTTTTTISKNILNSQQQTTSIIENDFVPCGSSTKITANQLHPPQAIKKQGVSGESSDSAIQQSQNIAIPKYEKDFRSKQLIKDAIMDNDFLKNIDSSQVRELVESMYNLDVEKGEYVIREGEVGAHLYVSAEGEFEVIKSEICLGVMGPGKAFGELAILYNCTRTASIRIISDSAKVWVLDRRVFQQLMMRSGMQRIEDNVRFLRSVPLLRNLSSDFLAKIADVLEVEFYPAGTYIIRQGQNGDTFFLISQGNVKVTQKIGNLSIEKEIRTLQRGDYFGEQALINEDKRTANIIALPPGVECLTLDRESFTHLIGDLCELKQKSYDDENRALAMKYEVKSTEIFGSNVKQDFPELTLNDLEVVATLGIGGFGRVELVKCMREERIETYALKCLKKKHIIDTRQEEHVFSERTIMLTCKTPFICRLYRTFRDTKYLYMLLEACMGGEVWTILRDRGCFDENTTQFIIGCVLEAFEYLHSHGIIYRDLKPENLMLDERGYVKLVDFGFAKHIGLGQRTWTFCGTPEYVAPEIILNKGHDRAVDYWALGILIHELLNGTPPFTSNDPMKTYNIILKGIDMIDFPKHMSRSAINLIKKLCRDVPAERLGYQKGGIQDIKKFKWFQGFDWDGLSSLTLIPPFLRPVSHPFDTCYFDKFPIDTDIPPDEMSGWDDDF